LAKEVKDLESDRLANHPPSTSTKKVLRPRLEKPAAAVPDPGEPRRSHSISYSTHCQQKVKS
jgi:hypothetical protein